MILGTGGIPPDDLLPFDGSAPLLEEASPKIPLEDPLAEQAQPELPPGPLQFPKEYRDEGFRYVARFCKASKSYTNAKLPLIQLLDDLYTNKIDIYEWRKRMLEISETAKSKDEAAPQTDRSNYVHAMAPFIDSLADRAYAALFGGPEFISVGLSSKAPRALLQGDIPASNTVQQLMIERLEDGLIQDRIMECLMDWLLTGTVLATVYYHKSGFANAIPTTSAYTIDEQPAYDCPVIAAIPIDQMIVDKAARHNNVQLWRMVGFTVDKTYEEVLAGFRTGNYDLNEDEFRTLFQNAGTGKRSESEQLNYDPDKELEDDDSKWVTIWEVHGKVPAADVLIESIWTIATQVGSSDPIDGVCIRAVQGPILPKLGRPFACGHFRKRPEALAIGMAQRDLDLLYSISQEVGQFDDNLRFTANVPVMVTDEGKRILKKTGGVVRTGMVFDRIPGETTPPIEAVNLGTFPAQASANSLQFKQRLLEQHFGVSDMSMGIAGGKVDSATEAGILQQQSQTPLNALLHRFCKTFLKPLLRMALELVAQNARQGAPTIQVMMPGSGPHSELVDLPVEALNADYYSIEPAITSQDHTGIATAQAIERVMQNLPGMTPQLVNEGTVPILNWFLARWMDGLNLEGKNRAFRPATDTDRMNLIQQLMAQMGPPPGQEQGPPGVPDQTGGNVPQTPDAGMPLVENGGPMGGMPNDANAMAQATQLMAMLNQGGIQ